MGSTPPPPHSSHSAQDRTLQAQSHSPEAAEELCVPSSSRGAAETPAHRKAGLGVGDTPGSQTLAPTAPSPTKGERTPLGLGKGRLAQPGRKRSNQTKDPQAGGGRQRSPEPPMSTPDGQSWDSVRPVPKGADAPWDVARDFCSLSGAGAGAGEDSACTEARPDAAQPRDLPPRHTDRPRRAAPQRRRWEAFTSVTVLPKPPGAPHETPDQHPQKPCRQGAE